MFFYNIQYRRMYTKHNLTPYLLDDAADYMLQNDRMLYAPLLQTMESYVQAHNIIIGGKVGCDLIVGRQLNKDSFVFDLFAQEAEVASKELTDALYNTKIAHIDAGTVFRLTNIFNREYTISINNRYMIKVYNMDKYRNINLMDVVKPPQRVGYFTQQPVKCIPEDLQLIEIYHVLHQPSKQGLWSEAISVEEQLFSQLQYLHQKYGGSPPADLQSMARAITQRLVSLCPADKQRVLVGDCAIKLHMGLSIVQSDRVQILTDEDPEIIKREVDTLYNAKKFTTKLVKFSVNLPYDFRLTKHTVYIESDGKQTALLDIYNAPDYEMIPTTVLKNTRCGAHFVNMRFKLVDLWLLRLISEFSKVAAGQRVASIAAQLAEYRKFYMLCETADLFPIDPTVYVGRVTNENVAKRALGRGGARYHPGYIHKK